MADKPTHRPTRDRRSSPPDADLGSARERIAALQAERNIDALAEEAVGLTAKLEFVQHVAKQSRTVDEKLRDTVRTLTAPEHYPVTIMGVERNGSLTVEVAGPGNTRMQVGVHPDVDPQALVTGATGLLARERNCLLRVISATGHWSDVGTVERYLDPPDRIVVRHRETETAVDLAESLRDVALEKGDPIGFNGDVGVAYQRLERPKREHLFDENVTADFGHLAGLDRQVARIKQIINFRFRFPELARKYRLKNKCGVLLHGPPGNGKTRIARCCAGYIRQLQPDKPCRFMHVSGSSDYSMWFGQSEQNIIQRFKAIAEASQDGPTIAFFDEFDSLGKGRGMDYGSGAPDRVINTFLSQLDGVVPLKNVIVLLSTNWPDVLDSAVTRPGRIDQKIEIPAPNRRAAEAILRCYLDRDLPLDESADADGLLRPLVSRLFAPNGQYAQVAQVKLNDGRQLQVAGRQLISGAMLENVVNVAAEEAAVREAETGRAGLCEEDLVLALEAEIVAAVSLLSARNVKNYVKSIPREAQPIAVDSLLNASTSTFVRT